MIAAANRLRRHGDFQQVYKASRKRFGKQMSYFFVLRSPETAENGIFGQCVAGARVGLTVSRAMGKAVDRNRIKRRMREAVRRQIGILHAPVDVVLHPKRSVTQIEFSLLELDVRQVFVAIQEAAGQPKRVRSEDRR
jgi:ribonuclease P protein component